MTGGKERRKNGIIHNKVLAIMIVLAVSLAAIPMSALADDSNEGSCGKDLSWAYSSKTLNIYGSGAMDDYIAAVGEEYRDAPWIDLDIETVIVSEGVTSIGAGAFSSLESLRMISLPNGLTSIGELAFSETSITDAIIPETVTVIGQEAFGDCENLSHVILPKNLKSVENGAFRNCSALKDIELPSGMEEIGRYAFSSTGIEKLSVPNSVRVIGDGAFYACKQLRKLTLPDGLDYVGYYTCGNLDSLRSITIPDKVKRIEDKSFAQSELEKVVFPKSLESIGYGVFDHLSDNEKQEGNKHPLPTIYYKGSRLDWEKIEIQDERIKSANVIFDYVPSNTMTIRFDPNGGYWRSDSTTSAKQIAYTVDLKEPYIAFGEEETPSFSGRKYFIGWSKDKNGSADTQTTFVDEACTVYAIWEDIPNGQVLLTLDGMGGYLYGKGDKGESAKYVLEEKGTVVKDSVSCTYPLSMFECQGKTLDAWYLDREYKTPMTYWDSDGWLKINDDFVLNEDTILYAKWIDKSKSPSANNDSQNNNQDSNSDKTINNGVVKGPDGKWALYKDDKVNTSYTGIAKNEYGWWRIVEGYVDFNATGIYKNEFGWWRVEDGKVDFEADGIYRNEYGWWKTTDGKVTFDETGVFKNEYGWYRVEDSKVDFSADGIYKNEYGWWKTTDGKVTFVEDGVFKNEYGWWKVDDSKVDFKFTGIAKNKYGTWYVKNGKVDFNKNGKVTFEGKTYTVKNGKVQ